MINSRIASLRATATLAMAAPFVREGASVFAVDLNLTAAKETKAIIDNEGGRCAVHQADVSRSEDVKALVEHCMSAYGRIDILHNNVGILQAGGAEEISEEGWDRHFDVNVKGMFLTCKYVLPIMVKQGAGAILNISSVASIRYTGYPSTAYNATKGAVNQMTQNIAVQYASRGIRANCALPGLMNTPMIREPLKETYGPGGEAEMVRKRDAMVPMGRMGDAWTLPMPPCSWRRMRQSTSPALNWSSMAG